MKQHGPIIGVDCPPISREPAPTLSMQCFENRHDDCRGDCSPFFDDPCGCACHGARAATEENRPPR